jgi:3-hydroxyisobutyryl-CoA hydrolase
MGGGVGLSINAMHRVCTDTTIFAMPESKIGLFCDVGVHYHLSKLPLHLKNALMLCSE